MSREVKEAQAAAASALREACEGKNAQQEICFLFVSGGFGCLQMCVCFFIKNFCFLLVGLLSETS